MSFYAVAHSLFVGREERNKAGERDNFDEVIGKSFSGRGREINFE